jgi:hypothetical protein
VLVEVPAVEPSRSNDVEMLGMGDRSRLGSYGRLDDDDDEVSDLTAVFITLFARNKLEQLEDIPDLTGAATVPRFQRILQPASRKP